MLDRSTTCGTSLIGNSTYFYEKAGVATDMAFTFSIIQYCLGIAATFLSWWASKYFGRFDLYAFGLAIQTVLLFIIGGLGCSDSHGAEMGSGSLLMVLPSSTIWCFDHVPIELRKWNWGAKSGFFWGGLCFATLVWAVIDLPETAGRTFIEINELFRLGVPARKFKSTKVDPFAAAKAVAVEINVKDPKEDLETSVVDEGRSTPSVVNK
ncbi:Sugar (and other) transporter family protein [Saccharomyces cerevisiae]|nr:Sugar (and other) transporter family protein [Saccharomyces cerevisiae]